MTEAMARIDGQNTDDRLLAERVLAWVSYAMSGLKLTELQHALSVDKDDEDLNDEDVISEKLLTEVCAGLVMVEHGSNVIRFVHATTQQYFQDIRAVKFPWGHVDITRTCLTYLRFPSIGLSHGQANQEMQRIEERYPFVRYASIHWGDHAKVACRGNAWTK
jgi:hypothetical protein